MRIDATKRALAMNGVAASMSRPRASPPQQTALGSGQSRGQVSSDKAAAVRGGSRKSSGRPTSGRQPRHTSKVDSRTVLDDARLQRVTGLLPHKMSKWAGKEPPADELALLARAMNLESCPVRRPKGNY
ncbi:hypothetical protein DL769_002357 [Monosporascus sp. CRB-8-3]|nr:hypothetical protein DL769_002357 [Monosporascus sp. CRB-8-3]